MRNSTRILPTQDALKSVLFYDPSSGVFKWKETRPASRIGSEAGYIGCQGYLLIKLDQTTYKAHRLAFVYMTGSCPAQIDHIDGLRSNNAWDNLRACDYVENARNASIRKDNIFGVAGVGWHRRTGKWAARIRTGGRVLHLGLFSTIDEASEAYQNAKLKFGYHPNHGRPRSVAR